MATVLGALLLCGVPRAEDKAAVRSLYFGNPSGVAQTVHASGAIDAANPFFQKLGTNDRSCDTCHQASDGWTVTPAHVARRFDATAGTDPIFRPNDGATSPRADVSTAAARRVAYNLLVSKGLIRIGLPIPADAEFELVRVDDPYEFASATELSLFRRPLPSTNLGQENTVMWDARETFLAAGTQDCLAGTATCFAAHSFNLADQANTATIGHAQSAAPLTTEQRESIVAFELGLSTAQAFDAEAGFLAAQGASGGPHALVQQTFYFGINDFFDGDYRLARPFDPAVFTIFAAWASAPPTRYAHDARRAIARGEALFNGRTFTIDGVNGFNDRLNSAAVEGTCGSCHNAPNAGAQSVPATQDIGISDASRRTADLPLYVLRNSASGEVVGTTDPGRGLITGRWDDIGRFKVPSLRALAARPPYFHNGAAADLAAVVDFYDERFAIRFTPGEKADLVAFLRAL